MFEALFLPLGLFFLIATAITLWLRGFSTAALQQWIETLDGSQIRNLAGWAAVLAIATAVSLLVSQVAAPAGLTTTSAKVYAYFATFLLLGFGLWFFAATVLRVLFLASRRQDFRLKLERLWRDTLLSMLLNIASFALLYQLLGVTDPDKALTSQWQDLIYFSTVTFSTLGYGDFQPAPAARLWAGFEAVIGNLHLGIFVGSVLLIAKAK